MLNARPNWKSVRYFKEYYSLSTGLAYTVIHEEGFPSMKVSSGAWRVDMNKTDEWFKKMYNQ